MSLRSACLRMAAIKASCPAPYISAPLLVITAHCVNDGPYPPRASRSIAASATAVGAAREVAFIGQRGRAPEPGDARDQGGAVGFGGGADAADGNAARCDCIATVQEAIQQARTARITGLSPIRRLSRGRGSRICRRLPARGIARQTRQLGETGGEAARDDSAAAPAVRSVSTPAALRPGFRVAGVHEAAPAALHLIGDAASVTGHGATLRSLRQGPRG